MRVNRMKTISDLKNILVREELEYLASNLEDIEEVNLIGDTASEMFELPISLLYKVEWENAIEIVRTEKYRERLRELWVHGILKENLQKQWTEAQKRFLLSYLNGELEDEKIDLLEFRVIFSTLNEIFAFAVWDPDLYEDYLAYVHAWKILRKMSIRLAFGGPLNSIRWLQAGRYLEYHHMMKAYFLYYVQNKRTFAPEILAWLRKEANRLNEVDAKFCIYVAETPEELFAEGNFQKSSPFFRYYTGEVERGQTVILLLRRSCSPEVPYIALEIYGNRIVEGYRRNYEELDESVCDFIREFAGRKELDWEEEDDY